MWVVYTSETASLAKLETLANSGARLPENRVLRTIELADDAPLIEITQDFLPDNWNSWPYSEEMAHMIQSVLQTGRFVGAIVPSVHSRVERNFILFPDYPEFDSAVTDLGWEQETFDSRLLPEWPPRQTDG